MKDEDRKQIIDEDSLDNGQDPGGAIDSGKSEGHPISSKLKAETLNENDVRGVHLIIGIGIALAVISAVGLGIAYATGAKQVKLTGLVTTDCAPCADMGSDILKAGGSAVDAVITTMLCNGLVNMHASGLGGGGYMMIRDHKQDHSLAVDFSPSASLTATPGKYTNNQDLLFGKMSVAVPGELAGLVLAHKYYGRLEWKDLVTPVAKLARQGFKISKDVKYWIDNRSGLTNKRVTMEENGNLYTLLVDTDSGRGKPAGTVIKRTEYADALDLIAADPTSFYLSDISQDIVESLTGNITAEDLSAYKANTIDVLRVNYTDFTLETPGPPAGGLALLHMLKVLEGYNFTADDSKQGLMYHRVVEAMKFGFALYPDIVEFNDSESRYNFTRDTLSAGHCEEIRQMISDNFTHDQSYYDPHYTITPSEGTSAVTAIDDDELFVSAISSLNSYFGSGVMTNKYGIILNNYMDTFDHIINRTLPQLRVNPDNMVKGGRRPRSAMAPTIFYNRFSRCEKRGAVGGTGGLEIIPATLQYLLDVLSFGMSSGESINRSRFQHTLIPNTMHVEDNFPTETKNYLKIKTHTIMSPQKQDNISCISAGYKQAKQLYGQSDRRKEGKTVIIAV